MLSLLSDTEERELLMSESYTVETTLASHHSWMSVLYTSDKREAFELAELTSRTDADCRYARVMGTDYDEALIEFAAPHTPCSVVFIGNSGVQLIPITVAPELSVNGDLTITGSTLTSGGIALAVNRDGVPPTLTMGEDAAVVTNTLDISGANVDDARRWGIDQVDATTMRELLSGRTVVANAIAAMTDIAGTSSGGHDFGPLDAAVQRMVEIQAEMDRPEAVRALAALEAAAAPTERPLRNVRIRDEDLPPVEVE
jgi:hypothetical protein